MGFIKCIAARDLREKPWVNEEVRGARGERGVGGRVLAVAWPRGGKVAAEGWQGGSRR